MKESYPVYTVDAECQDCYKCVRNCPVKAIKVRDGHAAVIPEMCVACGKCVEVCPVKAKHVRNDLAVLKELLNGESPVYVSLAPSWVNEFNECESGQLIHALKQLGFAGVSETALGAQLVSAKVAACFDNGKPGLSLSSACPAAVDYICKYLPHLADRITALGSPLMAHCRLLRDLYGDDIKVVFIGPCIAKKNEADRKPQLLNLALTFPELRQMLREKGVVLDNKPSGGDRFVPEEAEEGARYPIEGGMNETIAFQSCNKKVKYAAVSGIRNMEMALSGVAELGAGEICFVELLACAGGCVHGPCAEHDSPGVIERIRVIDNSKFPDQPRCRTTKGSIANNFDADAVRKDEFSALDIENALRSIGKNSVEDELNCGGCGYDSCRNFAQALLDGRAEPSMCVSYLKKQAQKKANALMRSMLSGAVMVDKNLRIIECNRNFAALFGEETLTAFDACPGMAGADLGRIVPFADLFKSALNSGQDVKRDSLRVGKKLLQVNIFTVEAGEVVGATIVDVTGAEMRREQIAARAREVIDRNLATVQEIACRLGEQMADTEMLLRSIADDYADETPPERERK